MSKDNIAIQETIDELIKAKTPLIRLRSNIRYYHFDECDEGIDLVETIDQLIDISERFKRRIESNAKN